MSAGINCLYLPTAYDNDIITPSGLSSTQTDAKRNLDRTLAAGHVVRLGLRVRARRGERQASLAYIITLLLLLLLTRARVCVCVRICHRRLPILVRARCTVPLTAGGGEIKRPTPIAIAIHTRI